MYINKCVRTVQIDRLNFSVGYYWVDTWLFLQTVASLNSRHVSSSAWAAVKVCVFTACKVTQICIRYPMILLKYSNDDYNAYSN